MSKYQHLMGSCPQHLQGLDPATIEKVIETVLALAPTVVNDAQLLWQKVQEVIALLKS